MAGFELRVEIGEGEKAVGAIKGFLIFAVGSAKAGLGESSLFGRFLTHFAVMARGVGLDVLYFDVQVGGSFLEEGLGLLAF